MKGLLNKVDRDSLVETASDLVNISSPTGHEQEACQDLAACFRGRSPLKFSQLLDCHHNGQYGRAPWPRRGRAKMVSRKARDPAS